jgi:V/A-type H+-transporting ATPase subunit C
MDDYGYINARIRAMKAQLLKEEDYDDLLGKKSLEDIKAALRKTSYAEDIQRFEGREERTLDVLIGAYRLNLERSLHKLTRISSGEPYILFQTMLAKYDVYNIKTILRGKMRGVEARDIRASLLPAGVLDEARLNQLVDQPDPSKVVDLLATWGIAFPFVIGRELVRMVREGNLQQIEYYLDESYFKWAFSYLNGGGGNKNKVREILEGLVDTRNIMATLLLLKEGIKPLGRIKFLPGGKLSSLMKRRLEEAETLEEGMEIVRNTPYGRSLGERETKDLPIIERIFEKVILEKALSMRHGDTLGIGVGISYIWAKEFEVVNLRTLTFGVAFQLDRPRIREQLIYFNI